MSRSDTVRYRYRQQAMQNRANDGFEDMPEEAVLIKRDDEDQDGKEADRMTMSHKSGTAHRENQRSPEFSTAPCSVSMYDVVLVFVVYRLM